jgi:hypothetical protein
LHTDMPSLFWYALLFFAVAGGAFRPGWRRTLVRNEGCPKAVIGHWASGMGGRLLCLGRNHNVEVTHHQFPRDELLGVEWTVVAC